MKIETNPDIDARAFQYDEPVDQVEFDFAGLSRREFVNVLGAGLLIVVAQPLLAQEPPSSQPGGGGRRGGGGGRGREPAPRPVATRVHIGKDGAITVMTGKVECGQGARAELTQAAAEELRVAPNQISLLMADTSLCPDDGITAGSRSTPSSVPAVRQGAAAARDLLVALAAKKWNIDSSKIEVRDGKASNSGGENAVTYADLAADEDAAKSFAKMIPTDVKLTNVKEWKVMGVSLARPNGYGIVTGKHQYPSDVIRPGMMYGKVLRPESFGAKLVSVDTSVAKAMPEVVVVEDNGFVGVAAPTSHAAKQALSAIAKTAKWDAPPHPSSAELWDHLRKTARGGVPDNPFAADLSRSARQLKQTYHVPYIQHCPMEPRAAVAEWADGKLTVWTGSQNPFGVRGELARAFDIAADAVRVIVPDFGGGFGGKHSGECAVEAARLAKAAKRPVRVQWTRPEEFTWAYFRPASLIDIQAGLDDKGNISNWFHLVLNYGPQSMETPYKIEQARSQHVPSDAPLRHGSYRGLGSTANSFAREVAMDELSVLAGRDPLEFRLAHLENPRLRAVLEAAAQKFNWTDRVQKREPGAAGVGLACSIDKGSFVATCAEIAIDPKEKKLSVRRVCQAFECGAIVNPDNLTAQVKGAIIMGLGPALREAMEWENGKIRNATFWKYNVPRFEDVPAEIDVHLLNRPDLPSVGAGETPLITIAAAIANAVFHATGQRMRQMPVTL